MDSILYSAYRYTTEHLRYVVEHDGKCPFGFDYSHRLAALKGHLKDREKYGAIDRLSYEMARERENMAAELKKTSKQRLEILEKARAARQIKPDELKKTSISITMTKDHMELVEKLGGGNKTHGIRLLCQYYLDNEWDLLG